MNDKPKELARANVLGVGISALNLDLAVAAVAEALDCKKKGYVCVTGVHGVSEAQHDPGFRAILNHSVLTTPDGMPMVWMGRWQGFREMARVYGPDLMLRICEYSQTRGLTHFLYGGAPGVAEELKRRLEQRYPGLRIVGTYTPPFRPLGPEEEDDLTRRIGVLKPDLFWVGLSTPRQEKFMAKYFQRLDATIFFGVGAAFDFHSGKVKRAPEIMQRTGFEWLFRLCMEPRRLWKRYLKHNSRFILYFGSQITKNKLRRAY